MPPHAVTALEESNALICEAAGRSALDDIEPALALRAQYAHDRFPTLWASSEEGVTKGVIANKTPLVALRIVDLLTGCGFPGASLLVRVAV